MKPLLVRVYNAVLQRYRRRRVGVIEFLAQYLIDFKLTYAGMFLFAGLLFCGMLAGTALEIPVYQLFCAVAGLLAVSFLAGFVIRPQIRLAGAIPDKATAGESLRIDLSLRNEGRFPARDVGLRAFFLPRFMKRSAERLADSVIAPGASSRASVTLHFQRRGLYRLPYLLAYSSFPFRLWRSRFRPVGGAPHRESVLALPRFHPLEAVHIPAVARHQPGGIAMTSHVGESPEYIGSREYRPGDSVRHLDFRAWARLARPVVREYQEEYYIRIALVLDTYVAPGTLESRFGFPNLEGGVSLCAALSDALSTGEYIVDLFAVGDELHLFRSGRHLAHHENVLEILACVEPSHENPFAYLAPALLQELERVSTAIFLFLEWDESRERLVRAAREAGCRVKVSLIGPSTPPHFPVAAERGGDDFQVVTPDDIAAGRVREL